ncbi:MAG: radical SAM protein [Rudanella sp.]|nr:radical SAM protein [Rudanella sp.]
MKELSFQPFVFRVFEDGLFNRNREPWAELFFVDSFNCVSSIMFNGTTLGELRNVLKKLVYAGQEPLSLCDVVLTVRPEKLTSKTDPTKSWYIGRFCYELATPEMVAQLADYAADYPIYRRDTLKQTANYLAFSESFSLPPADVQPLGVGSGEEQTESVQEVEAEVV